MAGFYTEASYENAVIKIFTDILGYQYIYAPNLERDYRNPFYEDILMSALRKINPKMNNEAIQNALYKLHNFDSGSLLDKNIAFMNYLQNGIPVKYYENSRECSGIVYLIDYNNPAKNNFTVTGRYGGYAVSVRWCPGLGDVECTDPETGNRKESMRYDMMFLHQSSADAAAQAGTTRCTNGSWQCKEVISVLNP